MRLKPSTALLILAPATLLYAALTVYPAIRGLLLSLTNAQGVAGGDYIGFSNYAQAFADPSVQTALLNTAVFTIVVVFAQNAAGLALAAWMHKHVRVQGFVRVTTLIPAMMALVVIGYVWSFIYSPIDGPLNSMLRSVGLGSLAHSWLGDPSTALMAVAVANVWMYTGYSATIYLSGFLSIPPSVLEAASLDGANGWKMFRTIEWPLIAPAFTVSLTLSVIGSLRIFDLILVMTQGGPGNATQSLSYVIYYQSFTRLQFGYGTAIAMILLVITVAVALILNVVLRRREIEW